MDEQGGPGQTQAQKGTCSLASSLFDYYIILL